MKKDLKDTTSNDQRFEHRLLHFLHQFSGLENLDLSDLANYKQKIAETRQFKATSIEQDLLWKEAFVNEVLKYFKSESLTQTIQKLLPEKEFAIWNQAFQDENEAKQRDFVVHLLTNASDITKLIEAFNQVFECQIKMPEEYASDLKALLEGTLNDLKSNMWAMLSEATQAAIKTPFNDIIECLVNSFPRIEREAVLTQVNDRLQKHMSNKGSIFFENVKTKVEGLDNLSTEQRLNVLDTLATELFKELDIDTASKKSFEALTQLLSEFDPLSLVKPEKMKAIAENIQEKLLPCLVNMFPFKDRQGLLNEATVDAIQACLNLDLISQLQENQHDPARLATLLFGKILAGKPLPQPIDIQKERKESERVIVDSLNKISNMSAWDAAGNFFSNLGRFKTFTEKKDYLALPEVEALIKSEPFLKALSLMLPYNQWLALKKSIGNKRQLEALAKVLIDYGTQKDQQKLSPEKAIDLINKALNTTYQFVEKAAQEAQTNLMNLAINDALEKEKVLDILSIMFPFKQWSELETALSKDVTWQAFSKQLLTDMMNKRLNLKDEPMADLLNFINTYFDTNKYETVETTLTNSVRSLQMFAKHLGEAPEDVFNEKVKTKLAEDIRAILLPILVLFIVKEKQEDFKQHINQVSGDKLIQFLRENKTLTAMDLEGINLESIRLTLNKLLPKDKPLLLEDMVDFNAEFKTFIDAVKETLTLESKASYLTIYLKGNDFKERLTLMFNEKDKERILAYLAEPDKPKELARFLDQSHAGDFLEVFESFFEEGLIEITSFSKGLQNFKNWVEELSQDDNFQHFDQDAITDEIENQFLPILFHEDFLKILEASVGFLNADELRLLLNKVDPSLVDQADKIPQLLTAIRKQNSIELRAFLMDSAKGLEETLEAVLKLANEVLKCQCFYNGHDKKGASKAIWELKKPVLLEGLSDSVLQGIHGLDEDSRLSEMTKHIFFLQGLRRALPINSKINAAANKTYIKTLERVNAHLLAPMISTIEPSVLSRMQFGASRSIKHFFQNLGFGLLNGLKSAANYLAGDSFTISHRNEISIKYEQSSIEFSEQANQLKPFLQKDVQHQNCENDTIVQLEKNIGTRGLRFFDAVEKTASTPEEKIVAVVK